MLTLFIDVSFNTRQIKQFKMCPKIFKCLEKNRTFLYLETSQSFSVFTNVSQKKKILK